MILLPGDTLPLPSMEEDTERAIILGNGVALEGEDIIAIKPGRINSEVTTSKSKLSLLTLDKKYTPKSGDSVIGIITNANQEFYSVDINGICSAQLNVLSFENATRRNRPMLHIGDLVYANLVSHSRAHVTVSCVNEQSRRAEGFGQLNGGLLVELPIHFTRALLTDKTALKFIGKEMPYEVAIGVNGRLWVKTASCKTTVILARTLEDLSKQKEVTEDIILSLFRKWKQHFDIE
ncbi:hypothetical protein MP638_004896 [Amoeboaphelidium occidentale]|nr:hypothetical protein MP638_004896 [Amoeboaphelidium occidentale]